MIKFNDRQIWLDALRAFLALGVVMNHVHLLEGGGMISYGAYFYAVIVPCFFFLSGFLGAKSYDTYTFSYLKARTSLLFRSLVVPGVFFMFVAEPWPVFVGAISKGCLRGNYFLLALFEIYVVNLALLWLCNKFRLRHHSAVLIFSGLAALTVISALHGSGESWFQWKEAACGNVFFTAGMLAGRRKDIFINLLSKTAAMPCAITLYAALCLSIEYMDIPAGIGSAIWRLAIPCAGTLCLFSIFCRFRGILSANPPAAAVATYCGQRTLATYTLFWVLIPLLDWLNSAILLPLAVPASAVYLLDVAAGYTLCLVLNDLLCLIPYFEKVIFGRSTPLRSAPAVQP